MQPKVNSAAFPKTRTKTVCALENGPGIPIGKIYNCHSMVKKWKKWKFWPKMKKKWGAMKKKKKKKKMRKKWGVGSVS